MDDDALRTVVADYTREAGVRNLERELGKLLRKTAAEIASGECDAAGRRSARTTCRRMLGRQRFFAEEVRERTSAAGVATGLAVTGTGGDVLFVEATSLPGEPGLTLTGQLGDVMKESAEIAMSYIRANSDALGVDADALDQRRFHVHVPAGAVPKDGPSAGVTMTTALVSRLTGRPVRADVGMTGEVTLQGRVLPIGGLKQKVLAAQRAGLTTVVLPAAQRPRPRGRPRVGAGADDLPPGRGRHPGPRLGAGAGARSRAGRRPDRRPSDPERVSALRNPPGSASARGPS